MMINKNFYLGRNLIFINLITLLISYISFLTVNKFFLFIIIPVFLIFFFYIFKVIINYKLASLVSIFITFISLIPYFSYGMELSGNFYFSSAYSVDFQQYLVILKSLLSKELPLMNPYYPSERAYYHFGLLLPLASALKLFNIYDLNFFSISNIFFIYSFFIIFQFFIVTYLFFFKSIRSWLISIICLIFFSSYKSIYAFINYYILSNDNYDTDVGFKLFQNDMLFGVQYIYSALLIIFIIKLLFFEDKYTFKTYNLLILFLIFLISPFINAFSIVCIFSICAGYIIVKYSPNVFNSLKSYDFYLLVLFGLFTIIIFPFSGIYVEGQRMPKLDVSIFTFFSVIFGFLVNFFVLIFLYFQNYSKSNTFWKMSSVAIIILLIFIAVFSIDQNDEGKFAISRRIGTFLSILLFINIQEFRIKKINILILLPGLMTFVVANYLIIFGYLYENRTVSIDKKLLDINKGYLISNEAYLFTDKYRFNFDMITGAESIKYPNSLGFKQYSPNQKDLSLIDVDNDKPYVNIIFENNTFQLVSN